MISAELNKKLVSKFPNLLEKYLAEVDWQEGDDTGSHTVYGDVFTNYLIECILNNHKQKIQQAFDFIEELLEVDDDYIDEVVCFSVLESLKYLFKERNYLTSYLGQKSKKNLAELD